MPKTKQKSGSSREHKDRPIHPYSRKALKLGKQIIHEKRVESARSNQSIKVEILAEKLRWFQDHLDDRHIYTKQDVIDLVMQYRNRFNDELEQINIISSIGNRKTQSKQHASRESAIKITMEEETNQFESSGIEVPDLLNKKNMEDFKNWKGEVKFIQNLKLRKISSRHLDEMNNKLAELNDVNEDVSCVNDNEAL